MLCRYGEDDRREDEFEDDTELEHGDLDTRIDVRDPRVAKEARMTIRANMEAAVAQAGEQPRSSWERFWSSACCRCLKRIRKHFEDVVNGKMFNA